MEKQQKKTKAKEIVSWEAEEYIHRDKSAGWYVVFVLVVIALVALSVVLKWWSFTVLIVLSAIALVLYGARPPRVIKYSLSDKGLMEGEKLYNFSDFKSFGILQDEKKYAIVLTPFKRFSPSVTVYFPKKDGEAIVDAFGMRLPMEEVRLDALDKIVKKLGI